MDRPAIIRKTAADLRLPPNLADYAATRAAFSWDAVRAELAGLPGGRLNIAHETVERHAVGPLRDKAAFRFLGAHDTTNRFANVLRARRRQGRAPVRAGRRACRSCTSRCSAQLKNGTVVSPLFSAFGPEPIATRIKLGEGKVLVTTELLYRRKVAKIRASMPTLQHVLLVGEDGAGDRRARHARPRRR
jgi:acetyl-CoA synthetase